MRLLDLFCGAGGAAMGYHRAGLEVFGVDHVPQPHYPFRYTVADALDYLEQHWQDFDAIHASPPCLASSTLTKGTNKIVHLDLVPQVRRRLAALPIPTVVENVQSASMRPDLTLCGQMFDPPVYRHRHFELSFEVPRPPHPPHLGRNNDWRHGRKIKGAMVAVYGTGGSRGGIQTWQAALDCGWIRDRRGLADAIPPAYTEHIGKAMINL